MNDTSKEISVLMEISHAVACEKNVHNLLEKVLFILDNRMGMLQGTFTLLHGDLLRIEASRGISDVQKQQVLYRLGEGITGHVAETGRPHIIPDISEDPRFLNRTRSPLHKGRVAFLCVPIIHMEEVIGTLSIEKKNTQGLCFDNDIKLIEIVGNITADAVAVLRKEREERESLLEENRRLRDMLAAPGELVGNSRIMRDIYSLIRQVAASEATVLLRGSSGTGKELVARAISGLSIRKNKPYVVMNCAAMPESLVESELFGHEKGAFTGASQRRTGRAEAADGGTLFLDEVGDLSLMAQAKLLRFIQERTFSRLGSSMELKSDVRFIAATSKNLEELIAEGKFRVDLYYRLNIFPIIMPDLKDRGSDIILLAEHFISKYNLRHGKSVSGISNEAVDMLMDYCWPGNVRELENCIERAVITASADCIQSVNLPPSLRSGKNAARRPPEGKVPLKAQVDSFEKELITDALERNNSNMSAAARELGLSPRMMHYKIRRFKIKE